MSAFATALIHWVYTGVCGLLSVHLKLKACPNLELQQLGCAAVDPIIRSVWDLILCVLQHSFVPTKALLSVATYV